MGFQIGLPVGGLMEAYVSAEPWKGLGAFGKGIGSALDQAFGLDDTSREIASRERIAQGRIDAKRGVGASGGRWLLDDYDNITEDPLPDSDYQGRAGSDLEKAYAGPSALAIGSGATLSSSRDASSSFPDFETWKQQKQGTGDCPG